MSERVEVLAYPEDWFHLHGKALSGLRHSHPLKDGEDVDDPWHYHEGEDGPRLPDVDRRGVGAAIYGSLALAVQLVPDPTSHCGDHGEDGTEDSQERWGLR